MNKKEEKLERLLKMQEHPENYTEEEIRQLMADDECRQLYEQMVHAADAIFANKEEYELNDKEVTSIHPAVKTEYRFKNIAAILIGVLMLSGIAYAAFHYVYMISTDETNVPTQMATSSMNQEQTVEGIRQDSSITVKPTVFKNTPLKDIVQEIANYHQLSVVVNNHEAAALRLYYPWNPQMPAEQVIGELNRFEKVNLAIKDNQLIIE